MSNRIEVRKELAIPADKVVDALRKDGWNIPQAPDDVSFESKDLNIVVRWRTHEKGKDRDD